MPPRSRRREAPETDNTAPSTTLAGIFNTSNLQLSTSTPHLTTPPWPDEVETNIQQQIQATTMHQNSPPLAALAGQQRERRQLVAPARRRNTLIDGLPKTTTTTPTSHRRSPWGEARMALCRCAGTAEGRSPRGSKEEAASPHSTPPPPPRPAKERGGSYPPKTPPKSPKCRHTGAAAGGPPSPNLSTANSATRDPPPPPRPARGRRWSGEDQRRGSRPELIRRGRRQKDHRPTPAPTTGALWIAATPPPTTRSRSRATR